MTIIIEYEIAANPWKTTNVVIYPMTPVIIGNTTTDKHCIIAKTAIINIAICNPVSESSSGKISCWIKTVKFVESG